MKWFFDLISRRRTRISVEDQAWADRIEASYVSQPHSHINLFIDGMNGLLSYDHLQFGQYYRCLRDISANGGGMAKADEELWFLGGTIVPYDGVHRLHFHDGSVERVLAFADVYPESETEICTAFKKAPETYLAPAQDRSGKSAALAKLRAKIVDLRGVKRHSVDEIRGVPT